MSAQGLPSMLGPWRPVHTLNTFQDQGGHWLARCQDDPRWFFLRTWVPRSWWPDEALEAFQRRCQRMKDLHHPGVLFPRDFSRGDGASWMVSEYVRSQSLEELIEIARDRGAWLEANAVVEALVQVCEALLFLRTWEAESGQEWGLDLESLDPRYILWTPSGVVCLDRLSQPLKLEEGEPSPTKAGPGPSFTNFAYFSPEMIHNGQGGPASVVFALGTVLFEALTLTALFKGDSYMDTLYNIIEKTEIPRLSALRPEVEPGLEAVVARALERRVEARYPDLESFLAALQGCLPSAQAPHPRSFDVNQALVWCRDKIHSGALEPVSSLLEVRADLRQEPVLMEYLGQHTQALLAERLETGRKIDWPLLSLSARFPGLAQAAADAVMVDRDEFSTPTRLAAAKILAAAGTQSAAASLIQALNDPAPPVSRAALRHLRRHLPKPPPLVALANDAGLLAPCPHQVPEPDPDRDDQRLCPQCQRPVASVEDLEALRPMAWADDSFFAAWPRSAEAPVLRVYPGVNYPGRSAREPICIDLEPGVSLWIGSEPGADVVSPKLQNTAFSLKFEEGRVVLHEPYASGESALQRRSLSSPGSWALGPMSLRSENVDGPSVWTLCWEHGQTVGHHRRGPLNNILAAAQMEPGEPKDELNHEDADRDGGLEASGTSPDRAAGSEQGASEDELAAGSEASSGNEPRQAPGLLERLRTWWSGD